MRTWLRRFLPDHEAVRGNRWLAPFENTLLHPRLWHLNRHSAAGGLAAGLFCGLIPGPLQMLGAAIVAVTLRVNLPLALVTTLYTNPLTIVPLYLLAYQIGALLIGDSGVTVVPPPEMSGLALGAWLADLGRWIGALGAPLLVGLVTLAASLATVGYLAVRTAWRLQLIYRWRHRRQRAPRGR